MLWAVEEEKPSSASELMPLVYEELRRLAIARMSHEAPGRTLQATALVHEAYLRLTKTGEAPRWDNRRHFFSAASESMRRILIDQARARQRQKRGGGMAHDELKESQISSPAPDEQMLAIDEALGRLAATDPEAAELVKMRYFTGMTLEEISEATSVSLSTVKRQWVYAKAWLRTELEQEP